MSNDGDRTILKPTPGGRGPRPGGPPPPPRPAPAAVGVEVLRVGHNVNPLVDAAGPLLALASQLRNTVTHPDPAGLCEHVAREVQAFEAAARAVGIRPETVLAARYCLCTMLDEIVLATPWGSESTWSTQSLLMRFHKEGWGGEKFFQILERVRQEPSRNLDFLELLYICLALGFAGKFKVQERGATALEKMREDLYLLLRSQRGEFERELSPHWRGIEDPRSRLAQSVPLWVIGAVAGALMLLTFAGFRIALSRDTAPVYAGAAALARDVTPLVSRSRQPPPVTDLATFLAPEVQQGLVEVMERPGETRVRILGTGLFGSGSAVLEKARYTLIGRIGEALDTVPGRVLVTGHTDSDPIPGSLRLKFASNYELSQKRADAVTGLLSQSMATPARLESEGRADTEPLAPNDSRDNKARNRRVEIVLMPSGGARP